MWSSCSSSRAAPSSSSSRTTARSRTGSSALPPGLPASALTEATNFLNARILGKTLAELRAELQSSRAAVEREIDALTAGLIEAGLASWTGGGETRQLIVRGQANLLEDLKATEDLERVRLLLADLETQREVVDLLARAEEGEGVRIFIGSENKLFSLSGSTMIAAPFKIGHEKIVGVLGVIGPTRLNYARIIPMVDYTAKVVSTLDRQRQVRTSRRLQGALKASARCASSSRSRR